MAAHLADIAIKHGRVTLVEFTTALVTGVVVASAVAYAMHRHRVRRGRDRDTGADSG